MDRKYYAKFIYFSSYKSGQISFKNFKNRIPKIIFHDKRNDFNYDI